MSDQYDGPELTRQIYLRDRRIKALEAALLEYWAARDWAAVVAADFTAAKLLPADMKKSATAETKVEGFDETGLSPQSGYDRSGFRADKETAYNPSPRCTPEKI